MSVYVYNVCVHSIFFLFLSSLNVCHTLVTVITLSLISGVPRSAMLCSIASRLCGRSSACRRTMTTSVPSARTWCRRQGTHCSAIKHRYAYFRLCIDLTSNAYVCVWQFLWHVFKWNNHIMTALVPVVIIVSRILIIQV